MIARASTIVLGVALLFAMATTNTCESGQQMLQQAASAVEAVADTLEAFDPSEIPGWDSMYAELEATQKKKPWLSDDNLVLHEELLDLLGKDYESGQPKNLNWMEFSDYSHLFEVDLVIEALPEPQRTGLITYLSGLTIFASWLDYYRVARYQNNDELYFYPFGDRYLWTTTMDTTTDFYHRCVTTVNVYDNCMLGSVIREPYEKEHLVVCKEELKIADEKSHQYKKRKSIHDHDLEKLHEILVKISQDYYVLFDKSFAERYVGYILQDTFRRDLDDTDFALDEIHADNGVKVINWALDSVLVVLAVQEFPKGDAYWPPHSVEFGILVRKPTDGEYEYEYITILNYFKGSFSKEDDVRSKRHYLSDQLNEWILDELIQRLQRELEGIYQNPVVYCRIFCLLDLFCKIFTICLECYIKNEN